ncbi:MAG: SsrA-binding protein SmpB [Phycisphaerae bacterium]|jgi:SsrA-binding protein
MAKKETKPATPRIKNKKAWHDFEILETVEAGIELRGSEVKSLRLGRADIKGAYCRIIGGECLLIGSKIELYKEASYNNHEPDRNRKLLLHKAQIKKILAKLDQKGYSLVPLAMYFNDRGYAKVEIALARGKKLYDKRDTIKNRDMQRDMERFSKY